MVNSPEPIFDIRDERLRGFIRDNAKHIVLSMDDILTELDRRAARRQAVASFALSAVATVIALAALVVTAVKS